MKKLIIILIICALLFMSIPSSVFAAFTKVNIGPDTDFDGDINIPSGKSYYINSTALALTDITTAGLISEAMLDGVANPADEDILTYENDTTNFEWHTPAELNLTVTTGTPADSQVAVWTADGIIEGGASLTYDGSNLQLTGDIGSTGTKITKGWFTDLEVANAIAGDITGTAATITIADNEVTDEENEVPFAADAAAPGDNALESDSTFTYNPNSHKVSATAFIGALEGNATTATTGTHVTVTDNEAENEENEVAFVEDAAGPGNVGLESDSGFTYNPSTGMLTAAGFTGALTGNADTITVSDESADDTCFVGYYTDASGSLAGKTGDNLTFASSTGLLAATIVSAEIRTQSSNADPDTTGEIKHDSTADGFTGGVMRWFDNDSSRMLVDLETDAVDDDYVVAYDAAADGFYMMGGLSAHNYVEHYMDVAAADDNYCHAQMAGTEALQEITTAITSPDVPRNIAVKFGTKSTSSGDVTITGTLADGTTAQTETFTIVGGDETIIGVKAFATVTQITIPATFVAATVIDVGLDNLLGLSNSINLEADMYKVTLDGVDDPDAITGNGNTTNNTLDCGTIAENSDYTIWYHN